MVSQTHLPGREQINTLRGNKSQQNSSDILLLTLSSLTVHHSIHCLVRQILPIRQIIL